MSRRDRAGTDLTSPEFGARKFSCDSLNRALMRPIHFSAPRLGPDFLGIFSCRCAVETRAQSERKPRNRGAEFGRMMTAA